MSVICVASGSLSFNPIFGHILINVSPLVSHSLLCSVIGSVHFCMIAGIRDRGELLDWLDKGADAVLVDYKDFQPDAIPPDRIILSLPLNEENLIEKIEKTKQCVYGFSLTLEKGKSLDFDLLKNIKTRTKDIEISVGGITKLEEVKALSQMGINSQIPNEMDLTSAFLETLVSDRPDGLYPTMVVDEQGVALGLVYSSKESIKESILKKRGIYHSRTRGLWPKGETSGAIQDLLRVQVDCDNDCLCFVVHQHGAGFCHKNVRTCFGPERGIGKLVRTLESRKANPQPGSYSNRLFSDEKLLHAKLREEVEELIEAKDKKDIAWEAADVIYFTLVAAVKAGVSLTDIEDQLEQRSKKVTRRKGDAKPGMLEPKVEEKKTDIIPPPIAQPKFTSLKRCSPSEIMEQPKMDPVDPAALKIASGIVEDIRTKGESALLHYATTFGDIPKGGQLVLTREELKKHFLLLPKEQQELLERSKERIRIFAQAQRDSILDLSTPVEGGQAGHTIAPVSSAGCYAPGGRYPLPSSVLMTAVTAKVAGVKTVWGCSPKPGNLTLGAAYVAGCDAFLQVGGAQAIGALAFGAGAIPAVDAIVGPGNKYVTAAKSLVSGVVKIDMLAGPSEVLVIADETADPALIAADLIAQAEHDPDAAAILVTVNCPTIATKVDEELVKQLDKLETKPIATLSLLNNSYTVNTRSLDEAFEISDKIAPEHLELHIKDADKFLKTPQHYGSLFLGHISAEVLGDYCAGPNHVLPTRGTSRYVGGLSVFTFLRVRSWLNVNKDKSSAKLISDAVQLGKLEGLVGHAAAAHIREGKVSEDRVYNKSTFLKDFIRDDFESIPPYAPIKPLDVLSEELGIPLKELVKVDANENPYGPIPEIIEAIKTVDVNHIYPDPGQTYLRRAIAKRHGISPSHIIAGSGADDILALLIQIVPPLRPVIIMSPTFGMYSFLASCSSRKVIDVPRGPNFEVDVEKVISTANSSHASIIFLTSPNNPTGNLLPKEHIIQILESTYNCLIVVDEAYMEFCPQGTSLGLIEKYPQLVILRTFSKWAALAGLRVGYGVCHPELVMCMDTIKQPYNVNVAAEVAALKALDLEEKIQKEQVEKMIQERANLYSVLSSFSFLEPVLNSASNFILMRVKNYPAWLVNSYLRKRGLLIRYYTSPRLALYVRISVGTPQDTLKIKKALNDFQNTDHLLEFSPDGLLLDLDGILENPKEYSQKFEELSKEYKMAIFSNKTELEINELLEKANIKGFFNLALSTQKKNTEFLKKVAQSLNLKKPVLLSTNSDTIFAANFCGTLSIGISSDSNLSNYGTFKMVRHLADALESFKDLLKRKNYKRKAETDPEKLEDQ